MTISAFILSEVSAILGLVASYYLDVPSGATIILLQAFIFFVFMLLVGVRVIK